MLEEKSPAEAFYESNQKRLKKIVGKFLYYYRAIYLTMLIAMKSLAAVQTKPKVKIIK